MGALFQKMRSRNPEYLPLASEPAFLDLEKGPDSNSSNSSSFSTITDGYYSPSATDSESAHHIYINLTGITATWQYFDGASWTDLDADTTAKLEQAKHHSTPRGDLTFKGFGDHLARVHFDTMEAHCADISCYDDYGLPLHPPVKLRRIIIKPTY